MAGLVKRVVETERQAAKDKGGRFRVGKPPKPQPPDSVERDYIQYLLGVVGKVRKDVDKRLTSKLSTWLAQASGRSDAARLDVEDIDAQIRTAAGDVQARFDSQHIRGLEAKVRQYWVATSAKNLRQLRRELRAMIGLDAFPVPTSKEARELRKFLRANVKLIQSLGGTYIDAVETIVTEGVQAGDRAVRLQKKLDAKWVVAESRAKLIARDQVNKMNGALTQVRQTSLGIDEYIWRTSRDERVRASHLSKEGKKYKWSDPPNDTGHPGHDINCRCSAEPVIPGEPPGKESAAARAELQNLRKAMKERQAKKKKR